VAELELSMYDYTVARRASGGAIFVNESRGSRYYVEETVLQAVAGRSNIQARDLIVSVIAQVKPHVTTV